MNSTQYVNFVRLLLAALTILTVPQPASARTIEPSSKDLVRVMAALGEADVGDLSETEQLLLETLPGSKLHQALEAHRAIALLREEDAKVAINAFLDGETREPELRARMLRSAAGMMFLLGRYGEAAVYAEQYRNAGGANIENDGKAAGVSRLRSIAEILKDEPPQTVQFRGNGTPAPISRDLVGLIHTPVTTPKAQASGLIDSGANLSVASQSAARRMGLRFLDGQATVGNSVGGGVDVQLAVADRIQVGGATLRNVKFLVIDDTALSFSTAKGPYVIDVIIGLPVLRALRSLVFGPGDWLRLDASSEPAMIQNLRMVGSDPFLVASIAGHEHPFFLDTGANRSSLFKRFANEHPEISPGAQTLSKRSGAGGASEEQQAQLNDVPIRIGKAKAVIPTMKVKLQDTIGDVQRYGVLGADLFDMFKVVTIDFENMLVSAAE